MTLLARAGRLDGAVFESVASWHAPVLDATLPALSTAASYSRLWLVVAGTTAAVGGEEGRRAALAGVTSLAITSAAANLVVKSTARRPRPHQPVPESRRLRQPGSTSFPSGHSASAAAFATSMGAWMPALRIPLTGLAGVVAFSRVYTGVHYPLDVVGGWLLGSVVAGTVTGGFRRWDAREP